jgi:hypothetical protein
VRCTFHTNRGQGGHIIILEEAAYIKPELVYQVVLPVLSTGASLLAISTISPDADNMLKQLVSAKNARGMPIIHTINMEMVCETCKRAGKDLTCAHLLGQIPAWQQRGRHADIQAMMATQESTFLVEMRGVESDEFTKPAFDVAAMRNFAAQYYTHDGGEIRHIFIGVDPAAGGAKSEYAVVSAFYTSTQQLVVCGAEAGSHRDNADCASMLINHIIGVRRDVPGAQNARIVFIPESNLGFMAMSATDEIRRAGLRDICVMREDDNRAGIKTNRALKEVMAMAFNLKLMHGNAFLLDRFVCVGEGRTPEDMRDEVVMQLRNFSKIVKPPRDPRAGQPTVHYSGKAGYGFDDLTMALLLLNVLQPKFWTSEDMYGAWH